MEVLKQLVDVGEQLVRPYLRPSEASIADILLGGVLLVDAGWAAYLAAQGIPPDRTLVFLEGMNSCLNIEPTSNPISITLAT